MRDAIAPFLVNSIEKMRKHTLLLLLLRKQLIVCRGVLSSVNKKYFTASTISRYFNTPLLHKIVSIEKILACLETTFSKNYIV